MPNEPERLADLWCMFCELPDCDKKVFLQMAEADDPERFKDCVPVLRERTGVNGGLPI